MWKSACYSTSIIRIGLSPQLEYRLFWVNMDHIGDPQLYRAYWSSKKGPKYSSTLNYNLLLPEHCISDAVTMGFYTKN